MFYFLKLVCML